jgi:F-type H+-transporting ATPase subunit delta
MARDTVARRYAAALFMAAKRQNEVEAVEQDARALSEVLAREPRLMKFLDSPEILDERKEAMLRTAFGERVRPVLLRFLLLVFRKNRISHLSDMIEEFVARAEEARGIVSARVVTAVALGPDQTEALTAKLAALTGKQIRLRRDVDPGILGGALVTIGDRILDGSVQGRLAAIRDELTALRVH